jgi:hypothetical protein
LAEVHWAVAERAQQLRERCAGARRGTHRAGAEAGHVGRENQSGHVERARVSAWKAGEPIEAHGAGPECQRGGRENQSGHVERVQSVSVEGETVVAPCAYIKFLIE